MKRHELEHLLRASGAVTNESEFVVIGSQAILGSIENPPDELIMSQEADIIPLAGPEKSDLIDGSIGELSPFHSAFGYYAHGVAIETAILAANWKSRLKIINNENTGGVTGYCLSLPDLAVSKILAHRPRDIEFVLHAVKRGFLSSAEIRSIQSELNADSAARVAAFLERHLQ